MNHEQIIENDMLLAQNSVNMQKVVSRINATHFIEMYIGTCTKTIYQYCFTINLLEIALENTKQESKLKTIAIFKIKLK